MIRGERFEVDLGSDDEQNGQAQSRTPLPGALVGDILERKSNAPKPPTVPTLKSKTGFPEHKKRESRFKQQKTATSEFSNATPAVTPQTLQPAQNDTTGVTHAAAIDDVKPKSWEEIEKQRIDAENMQKLAQMTSTEIEQEREELMNSLSPAFLQRLLKRSNIQSGSNEADLSAPSPEPVRSTSDKKPPTKSVSFAEPAPEQETQPSASPIADDQDPKQPTTSSHEQEAEPAPEPLPQGTIHFPRPPQPPDLDPSSETFLDDLHDKYFPTLPADPDKLEWMQPAKASGSYDPSSTTFNASSIRFDFKGQLLAPKTASAIPTTEGLHHHGDAPEAAGYTIAELAHLARSTYPAQRCIAFQTLGRILYRLGKGEFGDSGEPDFSVSGVEGGEREESFGELARGLWFEVEKENAIETLVLESEGMGVDKGRHLSAKNYATEAVWLWRKGGGRRWKAG